ncbi:MAG: glycosyltransferase family 39 protein [Dehalococcoidia bacterium]
MDAAPHRPLGAIVREWIALLDLPTTPVLRRRLLVGGVGLGALVALWPVIVRGGRVPTLRDLVIWLLGLLAVGAVLAVADLLGGVRFSRPRFADLALVALPMLVAALLTFPNLADPYFSAIGDEYAFWEFARELAKGLPRDPFSQAGVYGNHPVLSSYLMAATIKLFGPDQAGWRAAAALSLVVAAGGMALLGALAQGRVAGLVAGTGVAVAHPLLAYAHTGYNNIQAVPLTILSLAAGLAGRRVGSAALAFVGGVFAGFGWYTFYTGRVAIAALLALVVLQPGRGRRWLQALTAMFGFVLAILPLIASSKEEVITKMLAETAAAPAAGTDGIEAVLRRIVTMTVIAIRAPGTATGPAITSPAPCSTR